MPLFGAKKEPERQPAGTGIRKPSGVTSGQTQQMIRERGTKQGASSSPSSGISWKDYNRYEQDYNGWKTTGQHGADFGSWATDGGLQTWRSIRDRAKTGTQAALIGDRYYAMDKDTYGRYEKDYAVWKKTGKHSEGFDTWARQDELDNWRTIRDYNIGVRQGKNPSMELQSTINGLDPEVLRQVQETYRSSWKYGTTDEDLVRKAQGLPPKSKDKYYKRGTEFDSWLYSQGLPSTQGDYFQQLYNAAAQDIAARRQAQAASGIQQAPAVRGQDLSAEQAKAIAEAWRGDWSYASSTEDKARKRGGRMPKSVEAMYTDSEADQWNKANGLPPAALLPDYMGVQAGNVSPEAAAVSGTGKKAKGAETAAPKEHIDFTGREQLQEEIARLFKGDWTYADTPEDKARKRAGRPPKKVEDAYTDTAADRWYKKNGLPPASMIGAYMPQQGDMAAMVSDPMRAIREGGTRPASMPTRQDLLSAALGEGKASEGAAPEAAAAEDPGNAQAVRYAEDARDRGVRREILERQGVPAEILDAVYGEKEGGKQKDAEQEAASGTDLLEAAVGGEKPSAERGLTPEQEMALAHGQGHLDMLESIEGGAYVPDEPDMIGELQALYEGYKQADREQRMFIDQQIEQNMHELEHIQAQQGKPLTGRARELWIEGRTHQLIPEIEAEIAKNAQTDADNDAIKWMHTEGWDALVESAMRKKLQGWTRDELDEDWPSEMEQTVLDYVFNTQREKEQGDPEKIEQEARERAEEELEAKERERSYEGDPFAGISDEEIEAIADRYDKSVTGYYIRRKDHDEDPALMEKLEEAGKKDEDANDAYEIYKRLHGAGSFMEEMMATSNHGNNMLYDEYGLCAVMSADEAAMFDRMAAKDPAEAMKFYHGLEPKLRARARKATEARAEKDGPWIGTLLSIAHEVTGAGAMEGLAGITKSGLATLGIGDGVRPDDPIFTRTYYDQAAIGGTAEDIRQKYGAGWAWLYENGVSIAKNAVRNMTFGEMGLLFMGLDVAGDQIQEVIDKGGSQGQALAMGAIAGFAEYITERVSLEGLLDMKFNGTLRGALASMGKQMLAEGSEEFSSFVIDTVADALIMGDDSHIRELYDGYLSENGGNTGKAFWSTVWDLAKEGGMDALGGAFSGGIMGGPTMLINTYQIGKDSGAKGGPIATIKAGGNAISLFEQAQAEGTVLTGKAATEISIDMARIGMNDADAQEINGLLQQVAQQPASWVSDGMRDAVSSMQKVVREQRLSADADNAHKRQLEQEARARLDKLLGNITSIQQDAKDALEQKDLAKHSELMKKINQEMQEYTSAYEGEQAAQEAREAAAAVKDNGRQQAVKDAAAAVEAEIPASAEVQAGIVEQANAEETAAEQAVAEQAGAASEPQIGPYAAEDLRKQFNLWANDENHWINSLPTSEYNAILREVENYFEAVSNGQDAYSSERLAEVMEAARNETSYEEYAAENAYAPEASVAAAEQELDEQHAQLIEEMDAEQEETYGTEETGAEVLGARNAGEDRGGVGSEARTSDESGDQGYGPEDQRAASEEGAEEVRPQAPFTEEQTGDIRRMEEDLAARGRAIAQDAIIPARAVTQTMQAALDTLANITGVGRTVVYDSADVNVPSGFTLNGRTYARNGQDLVYNAAHEHAHNMPAVIGGIRSAMDGGKVDRSVFDAYRQARRDTGAVELDYDGTMEEFAADVAGAVLSESVTGDAYYQHAMKDRLGMTDAEYLALQDAVYEAMAYDPETEMSDEDALDAALGGEQRQEGVRYSGNVVGRETKARDEAYRQAVADGDVEAQERMVEEAARRAGYDTPKLYHGTRGFGFTEFDLSLGEHTVFASSDPRLAETYSGDTGRRKISEAYTGDIDTLRGEELLELAQKTLSRYRGYRLMPDGIRQERINEAREGIGRALDRAIAFNEEFADDMDGEKSRIMQDILTSLSRISTARNEEELNEVWGDFDSKLWDLKWMDESISDEFLKAIDMRKVQQQKNRLDDFFYDGDIYDLAGNEDAEYIFDSQLALETNAELHKGIYELYGRSGKQLVIDANGANWNQIAAPNELNLYGPQKTRDIAEAAKANGYDSVLIRSVRDSGGETTYNMPSDIYIFFDANQVKSADPVTYHSDGQVVDLSERFNPKKKDLRFSGNVFGREDGQGDLLDAALPVYDITPNGRSAEQESGMAAAAERRGGLAEEQGNLLDAVLPQKTEAQKRAERRARDRENRKRRQQEKAQREREAAEKRRIEQGLFAPDASMDAMEARTQRVRMTDQAGMTAKELTELIDNLTGQFETPTEKTPNPKDVMRVARKLLKGQPGAQMSAEEFGRRIAEIASKFRNSTDQNEAETDLLEEARRLARDVVDSIEVPVSEEFGIDRRYEGLMDLLRRTPIKVGPKGRKQLKDAFGSLKEFRKAVGNDSVLHIKWVDDDSQSTFEDLDGRINGYLDGDIRAQIDEAFGGTNTLDIVDLAEFVQADLAGEHDEAATYSEAFGADAYEDEVFGLMEGIGNAILGKEIGNQATYAQRGARAMADVGRDLGRMRELAQQQLENIRGIRDAGNEEARIATGSAMRARQMWQEGYRQNQRENAQLAERNARLNEENERLARSETALEARRDYERQERSRLQQSLTDEQTENRQLLKENERLGARERRRKDVLRQAEELFRAGKSARDYYEETRSDPDSYDHEVARQLNGMRLRNGQDVGGRINAQAFQSILDRSNKFAEQGALKLTFESPVRVFEEVAGKYSRKNSNKENARIYRDRKLMGDTYVEYGNAMMSERESYIAKHRERIREAWEGHGRTTAFDSAAVQLLGEKICDETQIRDALQDGHTMVVNGIDGTFVFEKKGNAMRLRAFSDAKTAYVYPKGSAKPVGIDGALTVDRRGSSVRVTDGNGTVVADIRNGRGLNTEAVTATRDALRSYYDAALQEQNRVLVENGYAPINRVQDYFPHIGRQESGIAAALQQLRADNLPTGINGLTATFTPGHPWAAHMQQRLGERTEFDAIRGFNAYVEAAGDQIYKTPVVQRLRQLENGLRRNAGRSDTTNAAFVAWLKEYTNQFANKKASLDREMEDLAGRNTYRLSRFLTGAFSTAAVGGNVSSSLSNLVSWLTGAAHLNHVRVGSAAVRTITQNMARLAGGEDRYDGFAAKIPYLNRAFNGSDRIAVSRMDRIKTAGGKALYALFSAVDRFSKESIGRAVYDDCMAKGMSEQEAIRRTDDFLIKNFADRGTGQAARVFGIKWLKPFAQFQLEVLNQQYQFRDIKNEEFERKIEKAMKDVQASDPDAVDWDALGRKISVHGPREALKKVAYLALLSLWGMLTRELMGRDQSWNVFGTGKDIARAVGKIDPEERNALNVGKAVGGELLNAVTDNAPFISMITGGGRVPVLGGITNLLSYGKNALFGKDLDPLDRALYGVRAVANFVPGGGQLSKTIRGAAAVSRGGQYNAKGTRLQFPVAQTPGNWARGLAFGPSAMQPEGYDFEKDVLPEKKTEAFKEATSPDYGMDPEAAYTILHGYGGSTNAAKSASLAAGIIESGVEDPGGTFDFFSELMGYKRGMKRNGLDLPAFVREDVEARKAALPAKVESGEKTQEEADAEIRELDRFLERIMAG